MRELDMANWEARCKRCGQCCFEKWIDRRGAIRFTRIPCRHLDIVTRQCRVYAKRLEVGEGCVRLTPENVPTLTWLPLECSYREHHRDGMADAHPERTGGRRRRRRK